MELKTIQITDDTLRPYPAGLPLLMFIGGSLACSLPWLDICGIVPALIGGVLILAGGLLLVPSQRRSTLVWFGLGVAVTLLSLFAPWRRYRRVLAEDEGYAEIEVVVTDTRLISDSRLAWLNPKRNFEARIQRIRVSRDAPWQDRGGRIQITELETRPEYGQRYRLRGALRRPFVSAFPHQWNARRYLLAQGIEHRFHPIHEQRIAGKPQWFRRPLASLLGARDWIIRTIMRNIPDRKDAALVLAMTLGMRGAMDKADLDQFKTSGMVHIFAVSGLHVGILATIIMLLLNACGMSFKRRHILLPILLLVYVALTGASTSALRAWLMISAWSIGRSLRLPMRPVNTLLAVALFLLVLNPLSLYQIGFQYSFLLVLAILLGWPLASAIIRWTNLRTSLTPAQARVDSYWWLRARSIVVGTVCAMILFWLAGAGLTARYNQIFIPFSWLTNLFVGISAWFVLLLSLLKVVAELLEFVIPFDLLSTGFGTVLGWLVQPIRLLAEIGGETLYVKSVPTPHLALVLLYYVSLFLLLIGPKTVQAVSSRFAVHLCLLGLIVFGGQFRRERVDVLLPESAAKPVLCIRGPHGEVVLVNTGTKYFSYSLTNWLRGEGVDSIDRVILFSGSYEYAGGLQPLAEEFDLGAIDVVGRMRRKSRSYRSRFEAKGIHWRRHDEQGTDNGPVSVHANSISPTTVRYTVTVNFTGSPQRRYQFDIAEHGPTELQSGDRRMHLYYSNDSVHIPMR